MAGPLFGSKFFWCCNTGRVEGKVELVITVELVNCRYCLTRAWPGLADQVKFFWAFHGVYFYDVKDDSFIALMGRCELTLVPLINYFGIILLTDPRFRYIANGLEILRLVFMEAMY